MMNIEALIQDGGEVTLGALGGIECAATATDAHNCLVMLVRREGETLNALLRRLDKAIRTVWEGGDLIDEINSYQWRRWATGSGAKRRQAFQRPSYWKWRCSSCADASPGERVGGGEQPSAPGTC